MSLLSQNSFVNITVLPPTTPPLPVIDALFLVLLVLTLVCTYTVLSLRAAVRSFQQIACRALIKSLPTGLWTRENTIQEIPHDPIRNIYGYHFNPHRPMAFRCVICLEDFVAGDIILSLPCNHDFHEACMYRTLKSAG